jgi:hypothetical protein
VDRLPQHHEEHQKVACMFSPFVCIIIRKFLNPSIAQQEEFPGLQLVKERLQVQQQQQQFVSSPISPPCPTSKFRQAFYPSSGPQCTPSSTQIILILNQIGVKLISEIRA